MMKKFPGAMTVTIDACDLDELRDELAEAGKEIERLQKECNETEQLRAAISGIAPWLSASLTHKPYGLGVDAGPEYRAACNAVFAVDSQEED